MANVELGFPLQGRSPESVVVAEQSWQASVEAECWCAYFDRYGTEAYDRIRARNMAAAGVLEALIQDRALPRIIATTANAVFGRTVALGELVSLYRDLA